MLRVGLTGGIACGKSFVGEALAAYGCLLIHADELGHVVLARGTYTEQYSLAGMFVWLMAWRVLVRYRSGTDVKALLLLATGCALFTALLEAYSVWLRRGYDLGSTMALNFNPDIFDITVPPTWQVLAFGLGFAAAAAARQAWRVKAAPLAVRQAG